jgi:ribosomal protein S18 acetylase RimI-like enzyme
VTKSPFSFRGNIFPSDLERIKEIVIATGVFKDVEIPVAVELIEDRLEKGEKSEYSFCIAQTEEKVIGYSCYGRIACTTDRYDLYWIAVDPMFQGKGIGKIILAETEKAIFSFEGKRVYIETSSKDIYLPTRKFYLSQGYAIIAEIQDFYADSDNKVIYHKILAGKNNPLSPASSHPVKTEKTVRTLAQIRADEIAKIEKKYLIQQLSSYSGKITSTAKASGISSRQLHKLMVKYGIHKEEFKKQTSVFDR